MNTLKTIMRLNASSCLIFGIVFVVSAQAVADFLGNPPILVIRLVGVGLLFNAMHLFLASRHHEIRAKEVVWFSMGDLAWWLATLLMIAAKLWITTSQGVFIAIFVGFVVAMLGVSQLWALGLKTTGHSGSAHLNDIVKSWLAMPLWVKIWLFALNIVFLAAFALWPERLAVVTLIAYVATIPLLLAQIAYDGGLRRILGLGHLVAWVPLLLWLPGNGAGQVYAWILGPMLAICLVFDVYDVWRFFRGERYILGRTPANISKVGKQA